MITKNNFIYLVMYTGKKILLFQGKFGVNIIPLILIQKLFLIQI